MFNNEAASAPTTPPGRLAKKSTSSVPEMQHGQREQPAPIGQGRESANGAKSMPGSRRTSGDGTFGMEKLSLRAIDQGKKGWPKEEEEVDAEGAQSRHSCAKCQTEAHPNPRFGKVSRNGR